MQLAAYKGPAPTLWLKVVHFGICTVKHVAPLALRRNA